MERDAKKRLGGGSRDAEEVKEHLFFADIDWNKFLKKQVQPPFKPKVESETDVSNFDPLFTDALPIDSLPHDPAPLSETIQENFKGFTYTDESAAIPNSYTAR